MDWESSALIGLALCGLVILVRRAQPRRRLIVALIALGPACFLIYRWTLYRQAWPELGLASGIAVAAYVVWWAAVGRKLPPPKNNPIRVWTPDDPF